MAASVFFLQNFLFSIIFFFFISMNIITSAPRPTTYIIHMNSSSMPKIFSTHHSWYSTILSSFNNVETRPVKPPPSAHIYTYNNVINGFSATLTPTQHNLLKNSPGFVCSTLDYPIHLHTTHTPEFLGLNSVSNYASWPTSDYGKDVIVGVVDSGIWPESKSFSDDGMSKVPERWKGKCEVGIGLNDSICNKKVIGARYFNKGLLSHQPDVYLGTNSCRDTDGHGTHTASIAAGNYVEGASFYGYAPGIARGMAPRARLAIYKVVWNSNGYASDVLAAIDQAINDGVDVLSLSIGLAGPLYEDPVALGSFAAMEKGIFVTASAGNSGPWFKSLHNGIPWLTTVAAGTTDRDFHGDLVLGNGISVSGMSLYHGDNSSVPKLPLVLVDDCENVRSLSRIRSKIVVCEENSDSLEIIVKSVAKARVFGAVFITNSSYVEYFAHTSFPATFLGPNNGKLVLDYVQRNPEPRASMEFGKTKMDVKPTPTVATYSSRGPSATCPSILKPDLLAPGSLILASWPEDIPVEDFVTSNSSFNIISGTSMAVPHVSGVGALLKEAHPEWRPSAIRSALMTTANPFDNLLEPIKENGGRRYFASPLAMGAGHINPNKALDPGLVYETTMEDYIRFLCGMNFTMKQIQMITRSSTFNCSNSSLDLNYPSFIAYFEGNGTSVSDDEVVREFERTVTNVGTSGRSVYRAKMEPINGFEVKVEPEELEFMEKDERRSYKLRLKGPKLMKELVVHGSLSWEEVDGNHVVRSPIVATRLSSKPLK